jgi:hypothetical protein
MRLRETERYTEMKHCSNENFIKCSVARGISEIVPTVATKSSTTDMTEECSCSAINCVTRQSSTAFGEMTRMNFMFRHRQHVVIFQGEEVCRVDVCRLKNGAHCDFHKCQPYHSISDVFPKE